MENKQPRQTKFDSMVTNKTMQLVKAVIPYLDNSIGTAIGVMVKLRDLQNVSRINNRLYVTALNSDKQSDMENMLNDIKEFLSDEERENIDMILSMMEMMNMDDSTKGAFMENYMDMFQGEMFGGSRKDNTSGHTENHDA